ncbi:MAG: cysteine desulfurase [Cyclobacteriaceae bacterium]|nr:cysteine desulfurase [Cyclobacteriaceae bacterium HetDA_MAG_MS6]
METITDQHFDVQKIRAEFPVLDQKVNGHDLIYFDNAATSQKPKQVIDALTKYYEHNNSNIHRGVHTLAERATHDYEETRKAVATFINANEAEEVVFTKGTTEGLNLVAQAYGRKFLKAGDEIMVSEMEHHSNIVPWQLLCQQTGAVLKKIPITENGELDMGAFDQLINERTKIVSIVYISNSLGTINPISTIVKKAHSVGAKVVVDGAQAAPHQKLDVKTLGCDFLAFSAHKMYGPTGVGVLYGKRDVLEKMDPYQGGGEMIKEVSFDGTTYNDIPYKFEAGTPNIGDVVAFKEAIEFIQRIGHEALHTHEQKLLQVGSELLHKIEGFEPVGYAGDKASVISFNIEGVHPFDLGMFLDARGIAVRTGHHCTQPVMDRYQIDGTVRASFAVYNTKNEIEVFADALQEIIKKFKK